MSESMGIDWERMAENLAAGLAEEGRRACRLERENAILRKEIDKLNARCAFAKAMLDGTRALYGAFWDVEMTHARASLARERALRG